MILTNKIKKTIKDHALKVDPSECCGLVVDTSSGLEAFPCKNDARLSEKHFRISTRDYVSAAMEGTIEAAYHSHTENINDFSEFDKFNSHTHDLVFLLYCTKGDRFFHYDPNCESYSYVGRKCVLGKQDCASLVRDFYRKELNIDIKDYYRDESWLRNPTDTFDRCYEEEGFRKVDDLKKYDCILFKTRKRGPSSHIAIYLGDNLILHQPGNCRSRIEEYNEKHKRITNYIIRHRKLI